MKKILIGAIFILGIVSKAEAQHPCDVTPVNSPISSPAKIGYCWNEKDLDGLPTTATSTKIYVGTNTTPVFTGLLTAQGAANAQGYKYFETPQVAFPVGTTSLKITISNAGGESAATPFTVTIVIPVPTAPILPRIVK